MNFSQDHFDLFGLPRCFAVDSSLLETAYRALQSQYHPDRAASLPDAEKRMALQAATQVNEAFQTLKSPLNRARYLLKLSGVDTREETNTSMPMDFLMQQMAWREAVIDAKAAKNVDALEKFGKDLQQEIRTLERVLASSLDEQHDHLMAAMTVRKLKFLEKLDQEIGDAIEVLLD